MGKFIDLTGRRQLNGYLVALRRVPNQDKRAMWKCRCTRDSFFCKKQTVVSGKQFRSETVKSCGCLQKDAAFGQHFFDLTGKQFGRLVAESYDRKGRRWNCRCLGVTSGSKFCKGFTKVPTESLTAGHTKSCGCLHKELAASRSRWAAAAITPSGRRRGLRKVAAFSRQPRERLRVSRHFKRMWVRKWHTLVCTQCDAEMTCRVCGKPSGDCHRCASGCRGKCKRHSEREEKSLPRNWFEHHADIFYCPKCSKSKETSRAVTDFREWIEAHPRKINYATRRPMRRHPQWFKKKHKFTREQVHQMMEMRFRDLKSTTDIGEKFGCLPAVIYGVVMGKNKHSAEFAQEWRKANAELIAAFPAANKKRPGFRMAGRTKGKKSVTKGRFTQAQIGIMLDLYYLERNSFSEICARLSGTAINVSPSMLCLMFSPDTCPRYCRQWIQDWRTENAEALQKFVPLPSGRRGSESRRAGL